MFCCNCRLVRRHGDGIQVNSAVSLRVNYAKSGADLRMSYLMSGTDLRMSCAISLTEYRVNYALTGNDLREIRTMAGFDLSVWGSQEYQCLGHPDPVPNEDQSVVDFPKQDEEKRVNFERNVEFLCQLGVDRATAQRALKQSNGQLRLLVCDEWY